MVSQKNQVGKVLRRKEVIKEVRRLFGRSRWGAAPRGEAWTLPHDDRRDHERLPSMPRHQRHRRRRRRCPPRCTQAAHVRSRCSPRRNVSPCPLPHLPARSCPSPFSTFPRPAHPPAVSPTFPAPSSRSVHARSSLCPHPTLSACYALHATPYPFPVARSLSPLAPLPGEMDLRVAPLLHAIAKSLRAPPSRSVPHPASVPRLQPPLNAAHPSALRRLRGATAARVQGATPVRAPRAGVAQGCGTSLARSSSSRSKMTNPTCKRSRRCADRGAHATSAVRDAALRPTPAPSSRLDADADSKSSSSGRCRRPVPSAERRRRLPSEAIRSR